MNQLIPGYTKKVMLQRFFILTLFTILSINLHAQSVCDVSVTTTDVRCAGESSGTAKVVVNGQAAGNPQGCLAAAAAPASYTANCTRTYSSNTGEVLVGPGEQVCLSGSNFTGGIQITGGTLVITGSAKPSYMNLNSSNPSFTLVVLGTAEFGSLNLFGSSTVKNYGVLKVPSVGFNGTLENNGTLTVTGDLNINAPYGNFTNKGSVTVSSNFNNFNTTLNGGTIAVTGTLNNNSGGTLNNQCTITIGGDFNNNNKTINAGKITAGAKTALNGSSLYQGYAGSVLTTGSTTIDGTVQGMSSNCASIKVTNGAIVNNTAIFSGAIDYCAPNGSTNTGTFVAPATKNCSCTSVSATYAWQSPLSGTTAQQNNLEAKTYSVVVTPQGCPAVTKTFTINAPGMLAAIVTPNGLSASVAVSGGTIPYSYVWSGNQSTLASASYATSGNYTVQVKDSKSCSTTQNFTLTAPTTPPIGSCSITVETKNPTCVGAGDGSATIYLNGNVLGTGTSGTGTQNPAGCSAVQASTYTCTTGCTQTITDNSAGINIAAGQQVCLTATAYAGNINVTGGTLVICGKATPQNINYNTNGAAFTIIVNGELTLSNLNLPANCTLKNYGKVTYTNSVSFNGRVENYGTMQANGDFNNNASTGTFFNYGTLSVSGNLNNNVQGINSGLLNIAGNLHINGGSTFTNNCRVQVGNELINNASVTNNGKIYVTQWTRLNGGSTTTLAAGASLNTQDLTLDGTVTGAGTTCSALKVTGQSIVNGSGKLQGQVSLCMGTGPNTFTGTVTAPATKTCSCVLEPIQYSSPLLGMNNPYQGLPAGIYTVTVQAEGCPAASKIFTITDPTPVTATVSVSGKTATVSASGQGALLYTWTGGASGSSNTHTFVNDGTYQVTVSDSKNCSKTVSFQIPIQIEDVNCSKLFVEYLSGNQVRITCQCPGSVCTIVSKTGVPPITSIPRPENDSIVLVKTGPNTIIEVVVTGKKINPGTGIPTPSLPPGIDPNPLAVTFTVTPESCAGKKDGAIQLSIAGGSEDYIITNNYTTQTYGTTINNLGAGDVYVKVYDNKTGYSKVVKATVGLRPANTYQFVVNSYTATGEAASVSLQAIGGNPTTNTVVQWKPTGNTGFGPVTIPSWLYSTGYITAKVSDSWACQQELVLSVVPTGSTSITPVLTSTPASCNGSATGSMSITNLPAGATVVWSGLPNASQSASVSGVAAGTYRADVFLTLANGNKYKAGSASVTVTEPAKLAVTVVQGTSNTNTYTAQVTGGTAPYTYQWSNSTQDATATLTAGGLYQVQIQDSKSCIKITQLNIPLADCPQGISLDINPLTCTGANSGKIVASTTISGAAYYWSGAGISNHYNATQENLTAGTYVVSVTGWNPQCISRIGVKLKQPEALKAKSIQIGNTVNIVVSNGTPNYTVVWRFDKEITDTRSNLTPGVSYTVDITDSKNCTLVYTFTYDPCSANPIQVAVKMNEQKATPQVSGGVGPYKYFWKLETQGGSAIPAGQDSVAVQNAINGIYSLTVIDSRGCKTTIQVRGPNCGMNALTVVKQATSCKTRCDGLASISGTLPAGATLTWNNEATAYKFVNACAGTHTVQISNTQGCYIEKEFVIAAGTGICPNTNPEVANPPGTCTLQASVNTATSKLSKQCAGEIAFIDIKITGGFAPYHMKWTVQRTQASGAPVTEIVETDKEDYQNALPGIYSLEIKDQRGCTKTVTTTVTGPLKGLESTIAEKAASCAEQLSGITFTVSGGVGPYTIEVMSSAANPSDIGTQYTVAAAAGGAAVSYTLTPNQGGAYSYKVKDAAGCTQIRSIALPNVESEAKRFHGGIVASQTRLAPGQSAVLTAYSITGYTLNWAGVAQPATRSQTVSQPGVYQVTYSKTGCVSYTRSVNITALPTDSIPKSMICTASQPTEIPIDVSDQCEDYQRLSAKAFSHYKYELYVAEQKQRIRNQYLTAVLGDSRETLTMKFDDKEEHYTLYYYDQSGNLVRTIPPAGAKPLTADKTNQAIDQMLSGSTAVITEHDYTTTYGYNSLNQLVHQDIPDHDRIDLWETAASSIDLQGSVVANLAYAPTGNGGVMLANTADKVQLYATSDAGKTWEKNQNIGLGKITAISRVPSTTIVYAGGEKGTFLRSDNGGRSWTLLPLLTTSTVKQVYFSTANIGWIVTESGGMYTSGDGGRTWVEKTALKTKIGATTNVTEASVNKTYGDIWVISTSNKIYQSTDNGTIWTEKTIESPTVTTVSVLSTDLIAAGPKGTLFKANPAGSSMTVQRTSLDKTITKLVTVSANTYYALTSDGSVYYSTTPATWTQVSGVSNITAIVQEGTYILASDATGIYKLNGATGTALPLKRARKYADGYVGLTSAGDVRLLDNNLNVTSTYALSGLSTVTIKDVYVIGTKLIVLGTDNNVYEGTPNGAVMNFTVSTPKHTGVSSFITLNSDLYVRISNANVYTILAYGSTAPSVTLNGNVTDVALSSATSGYAVESGKVKKITAGAVVPGTPVLLISAALNAVASSASNTYAAGENGELYVSTGTTFTYIPVVNNASSFTDAAYLSTQGRLELITSGSQQTYNETTGTVTATIPTTTYSNAKQISTTATAGQVLVAATGIPVAGQNIYSVDGNSIDTYLAGGDAGKIWYKESSATTYTAATINIQPLSSVAYANASTILAVGKQGTILRSTDAGVSWKMEYSGTPNDLTQVSAQGTTAVIIGSGNTVLYYSALTQTWKAAAGVSAAPGSVKVAPNVILLTAGTGVYKSTDAGATFTIDGAFTQTTATLRSITIDKDGYGFVVGDNGAGYRIAPTSTTTNTSLTYAKIPTDATPSDDKGTGLPVANFKTVQFSDRLTGYITAANGVLLKTTDGGAHWKQETGVGTGTGTPQIALSGDAQHGTVVDASGTPKTLRDQAETFSSRFWYDELGRLVLSQNAKQFNITSYEDAATIALARNPVTPGIVRAYSYTLYDKIGRIAEVGELLTDQPVTTYKNESQVQYASHKAFVAATTAYRHQTSKTYYDRNETPPQDFAPTYLRNRVAYTTYQQTPNSPVQQTHYSYDVHGNVNNLLQLISHDGNVLAKTVTYEYDLISGKVNKVYYQKEKADQLIHKYTYDGDNRITKVETSTDNVLFTKEASYQYYAHGPLARTQLGELNVETENYTYTIQGWIKQMQAEAFSYALGYNNTDYAAIGTTATVLATPIATAGAVSKGLYNGNIASMTSKTPKMVEIPNQQAILKQQYSYDQLNRITASNTPGASDANAYRTRYSYDANGNIKSLSRYDRDGVKFDTLLYNYETKAKDYLKNTNKLRWVDDGPAISATTADIEDQSTDNYSYDAIGNLVKDKQEQIDTIEWTVSGKVLKVRRTAASTKPDLEFEYDASGQRIVKKVIRKDGSIASTYYLRDASGNVMAVYEYNSVSDELPKLSEQYLYGSSRLGVATPGAVRVITALENILGSSSFGRKSYELSDHLGNVRATLSDYKTLAKPQIVNSATDYYPFGMGMFGRQVVSANGYRFGFNGKEDDKETGWQNYGMRMYNPALARFFTVDPITSEYPMLTPYQFASNVPIWAIDIDGLEAGASPGAAQAYVQMWSNFTAWLDEPLSDPMLGQALESATGLPNGSVNTNGQAIAAHITLAGQSGLGGGGYGVAKRGAPMPHYNYTPTKTNLVKTPIKTPVTTKTSTGGTTSVTPKTTGTTGTTGQGNDNLLKVQTTKVGTSSTPVLPNPIDETLQLYNRNPDYVLDCADIAALMKSRHGGTILEITSKAGGLKGIEYGKTECFEYHQVLQKDGKIYDPMYSDKAVPVDIYMKAYKELNPQGINVVEQ